MVCPGSHMCNSQMGIWEFWPRPICLVLFYTATCSRAYPFQLQYFLQIATFAPGGSKKLRSPGGKQNPMPREHQQSKHWGKVINFFFQKNLIVGWVWCSNTQEAEACDLCESESSLVFIQSSRKAGAIKRDSVLFCFCFCLFLHPLFEIVRSPCKTQNRLKLYRDKCGQMEPGSFAEFKIFKTFF